MNLSVNMKKRFLPALLFAAILFAPAFRVQAQEQAVTPSNVAVESTPEAQSPEANKKIEDEDEQYLHSPSVRALGAKLGMNPEQAATAFTVANFLVLAVLVGWFLIKTLPATFRKRSSAIQKHLVDARAASEEAKTRLSGVEERLAKLDGQIAAMRTQSEKDAVSEQQRIAASVEDEKQKILAAAEQEIAAATTHAQRQIQQYAAELAIEQAARKLVVSAETDRLLVQNFARQLTGEGSKGGQN